MATSLQRIRQHQIRLRKCARCPDMQGQPVTGNPVPSRVLLVGQAPGTRELVIRRPFAWTAGKTLFSWFNRIGLEEDAFRQRVYMAAVCRCFPGKNPKGGDRVPNRQEIANCAPWLDAELELLKPALILPVGKLAISRFLEIDRLADVVGRKHRLSLKESGTDLVPLPHPSGASTWHRMEPGRSLLEKALVIIHEHPAWRDLCDA